MIKAPPQAAPRTTAPDLPDTPPGVATQAFFQRATFQIAAARLRDAPADTGFEVAFAGRSNAGKSSAINALCHQRRLARTSKTPGRTQQLVFFRLDDERRLVDLPGYGFARVSLALKADWQALMGHYLEQRQCLRALVVVMDIRHPLTEFDRQMLTWCIAARRPLLLLLTKADKLGRGAVHRTVEQVKRAVLELGTGAAEWIDVQAFSSTRPIGLEEARLRLALWLELPI
ncbi:MAG: YihA family ribosome biogenesis GTP-binding protein [Thiohalocapsa sp. PB-PSB1]|jgi:GTP-binding protein|nr:MAG: YihA family ribosome biogenesis GTP-binding protein [Thiohalocapsa sp. PB-PSB1]HCS89281.1 YihA family ribosome biogenesis GTP-binding protein [Chromatiaceae bacterium]